MDKKQLLEEIEGEFTDTIEERTGVSMRRTIEKLEMLAEAAKAKKSSGPEWLDDAAKRKIETLVNSTANYVSADWPPGAIRGLDIADMLMTYGHHGVGDHMLGVTKDEAKELLKKFGELKSAEMTKLMKELFPRGLYF